jgi:hypothetical protein
VKTTDNVPESRAAAKREDHPYVHAVLLNDPVWRSNRSALRRVKFRHEPAHFDYWDAPEAICGRPVRVVYPMHFQPHKEEGACPECTQLIDILLIAPEKYPDLARQMTEQVQERESRSREKYEKAREKQAEAERKLARMFDAIDEEEELPSEITALLEPRAEHDESDASDTA